MSQLGRVYLALTIKKEGWIVNPNRLAKGPLQLCMDTLRLAADEPLTAEEITLRIMAAKGLDPRDARLRAAIRVQAGSVLKRLHRQKIAAPSGKGVGATWRRVTSD